MSILFDREVIRFIILINVQQYYRINSLNTSGYTLIRINSTPTYPKTYPKILNAP